MDVCFKLRIVTYAHQCNLLASIDILSGSRMPETCVCYNIIATDIERENRQL